MTFGAAWCLSRHGVRNHGKGSDPPLLDVSFPAARMQEPMATHVCLGLILCRGMSVYVARHGKLAFQYHFGLKDAEKGLPIEKDTIFRLYSMTKVKYSLPPLVSFMAVV